jgi:hypothetical protein
MRLTGDEFVRKYLLHVVPKGFTRIRHYGFLAGYCRTQCLAQIREALWVEQTETNEDSTESERLERSYHCPV